MNSIENKDLYKKLTGSLEPKTGFKDVFNNDYPEYILQYSNPQLLEIQSGINITNGSIERHIFHSKELKNERAIDIYLPPGYKKEISQNYPVLYMHDGNNLFYPEQSFAGVHWQVNSTIEKLIHKGLMKEIIVVGIHNTMGRHYEYTWTEMKFKAQTHGGGGQKYAKFIIDELKPFIDEKYRTSKHREDTAVMGSSLGGLISLYLGYHYPDVFSKIGVISPSLWWGYGDAFKDVNKMKDSLKIWLDMGNLEGIRNPSESKNNIHIDNLRTLKDELCKRGYKEGHNLGYMEDPNGLHNEASWANRFHFPMLFFFGNYN